MPPTHFPIVFASFHQPSSATQIPYIRRGRIGSLIGLTMTTNVNSSTVSDENRGSMTSTCKSLSIVTLYYVSTTTYKYSQTRTLVVVFTFCFIVLSSERHFHGQCHPCDVRDSYKRCHFKRKSHPLILFRFQNISICTFYVHVYDFCFIFVYSFVNVSMYCILCKCQVTGIRRSDPRNLPESGFRILEFRIPKIRGGGGGGGGGTGNCVYFLYHCIYNHI